MRLAIITTCTSLKAASAEETELCRVPADPDPEARADAWVDRLRQSDAPPVRVADMYRGGHWAASCAALDAAIRRGFEAELWVLSAGYGLLSAEHDQIKPYDATFSVYAKPKSLPAPPDNSVARGIDAKNRYSYHRAWWRKLQALNPSGGDQPRHMGHLAEQLGPDGAMLVIASDGYLGAIAPELPVAAAALPSSKRLAIVSAGAPQSLKRQLEPHMVPLDARFNQVIPGAMTTLNARAAAWLTGNLAPDGFDVSACRSAMDGALSGLERPQTPARAKATDDELKAYLHAELANEPGASLKRLHDRLRDQGRACSVERFKGLLDVVRAERATRLAQPSLFPMAKSS